METDLDILKFLAKQGEKHVHRLKMLRAAKSVQEFANWTRDELDLQREGRNARILQDNLKDEDKVKVPDVYPEHTTEKVLVMEYVDGVKANNEEALDALEIDREELAKTAIRAGLKQTVRDGFFHADPHPSNFLIDEDGNLIYLDFGMMGKLTMSTRRQLGLMLLHAANEEVDAAMEVVKRLGAVEDDADLEALKEDIEDSILLIRNTTIAEQSIVRALFDIAEEANEHGVHMPTSFTIMAKSMLTMEGIGPTIYPQFRMTEEFEQTVEHLLWKMNSPKKLFKTFMIDVMQNRDLFVRGPSQLNKVIEGLSEGGGESAVSVDSGVDAEAVVAAALIISSTFFLIEAVPRSRLLAVGILELVAASLLLLLK
ncbi:MAG: ABC1 kinase family protein [Candidatus Nanohaloarchaea archaeon]